MRALIFTLAALTVAAATTAPAEAQNYPWCAYYGGSRGGGENCGFSTYTQCMADVSGIGGYCARNTQYRGPRGRYVHY